uniref:Thrombospondin-type laminin G domain and EAR repeat-containing protein-like n=1 Tax=Oryzias latipes TaxID=8090 RepID=A0A3P9I1V7_ORYLA
MSTLIFGLLLLLRATDAVTGTWIQCRDVLPLDLLSFVLERDTSRLVPGVRIKEADGARGVHFVSPDVSMSFPLSQLLVNCDLFPKEFSVVLTLKVTRTAAKKIEHVFSLLAPKYLNKSKLEEKEEVSDTNEGSSSIEKKQQMELQVKRNPEPGDVLLGLKISPKRLHFLMKGPSDAAEQWVFRGIGLADNQWHTLVLAVGQHHVRLTVDCRSPIEIVPSRPFSSDLNIQGSRFHIGSRGRWKGLFSGLLRQLVLVPGSDATHQICPSSDPRLAALSVPPLLLDLPVMGRQRDRHAVSDADKQVSLGSERTCTEMLQGQLWFNQEKKGLYLCDGSTWITLLEDHKRLDYLLENQVLATSSETHDIEVFQLPGMGLMAAMAHRSPSYGSAVYLWTSSGFRLYQNISTHGALAWRHFNLGKKTFLVVSNSETESEKRSSKDSGADYSVVYKWSKKRKRFVSFQTLQTYCARDWEAFYINHNTYLAVANHRWGDNNHTIESVIYKWNKSTKSFEIYQMIPTSGAYDWEFFSVGPYHFLVVANAFDGVTTSVDSVIYIWIDGRFQVFQKIKTFCATDWEMFQIGSRVFLVVANGYRLSGSGPSQYTINSTIYELDIGGQLFVRFQDIVTYSAVDWEFFSLGEEHFLVVANSFNGESYSLNSILYRWQGYEGFVPVHWLPTIGCSDWEFFTYQGESYLIYSSAKTPLSKVFELKTY